MTSTVLLEDFGTGTAGPALDEDSPSAPSETDRLAIYDEGYQAGWEDAQTAARDDRTRIDAEFARNLQDLSFSFHEAKVQVAQSMTPLVEALVASLFPRLKQTALADQVLAVLEPLQLEMPGPSLALRCSEEDADVLETLLGSAKSLPMKLSPEPSLMPGQVDFIFGQEKHEINVAQLGSQIEDLVKAHLANLTASVQPEEFANVG